MIKWTYTPRRREKIFMLLWVLAVAVFFLKSGVERLIGDFRRLNMEIASGEIRLARLSGMASDSGAINAEYARRVSSRQNVNDSGNLIQRIENIARKARVGLVSLKPAQPGESGQGVEARLTVEIQDDMSSIARFFALVNKELGGIGIERVQIFVKNREESPHAVFLISAAPGHE